MKIKPWQNPVEKLHEIRYISSSITWTTFHFKYNMNILFNWREWWWLTWMKKSPRIFIKIWSNAWYSPWWPRRIDSFYTLWIFFISWMGTENLRKKAFQTDFTDKDIHFLNVLTNYWNVQWKSEIPFVDEHRVKVHEWDHSVVPKYVALVNTILEAYCHWPDQIGVRYKSQYLTKSSQTNPLGLVYHFRVRKCREYFKILIFSKYLH